METIIAVLVAIIIVQSCAITVLIALVNKARESKHQQVSHARSTISALVKVVCDIERDLEMYKEGYNSCYAEYKALYVERKQIQKHIDYIEGMHDKVISNLMNLLRQGKIIKSRHNDIVFPYEFNRMTKEEIEQFFGRIS